MKALVTGGAGFLGRNLVRELAINGWDVHCLVRREESGREIEETIGDLSSARVKLFLGSLSDIDSIERSIRGCDIVFHAAAAMNGGAPVLFANNVVPMRRIVNVAANEGVARFVLISSLGVLGTGSLQPWDLVDENCRLDDQPHLRDAYSYSKIAQEQIAWDAYRDGKLPLVVIRPGVIYGPGRGSLSGRIGLKLGGTMLRMGGSQRLPYTFVRNCAEAIRLAGTVPGIEGEAFHIVDHDAPTARQLLRMYRREVHPIRVLPVPRCMIGGLSSLCEWYHRWSRGQLPPVLTRYKSRAMWTPLRFANEKARRVLGWQPQVGFEEGLRETFAWEAQTKRVGSSAA